MIEKLRKDAERIARAAIKACLPEAAVARALRGRSYGGRVYLVAAGKAAWRMAKAASEIVRSDGGVIVTKYGHSLGEIDGLRCFEGGHPLPDENGVAATAAALELTASLSAEDTVIFLLSGGGSALFEKPLVPLSELESITAQLLRSGADIRELNAVRKRLSAVKGGRFALHCAPARVEAVVLSDVLGDPVDMIASGPVSADSSTCADALGVVRRYSIELSGEAEALLSVETPKEVPNAAVSVVGSVRELCGAAEAEARSLGYETVFLTDTLDCEARDAGKLLSEAILRRDKRPAAVIGGGETVVRVTGGGLGGRNQELALSAARYLSGESACVLSIGSDGTDGPTDAAGGYADGDTLAELAAAGVDIEGALAENDSYHALGRVGGLIFTGPTGTNVNDLCVALKI